MTVPSTSRRAGPFSGNAATTAFPFAFKVFDKTNIQVVKVGTTGVQTTLTLDSDYSVAVNADQVGSPGGTVTYPITGSLLAVGETLSIIGALPYSQTTAFPGGGNFAPGVVEQTFDRTEIQIQQLAEQVGRSLQAPVADGQLGPLPSATARASSFLAFDASGNPVAATGTGTDANLRTDLGASGGSALVGWLQNLAGAVVRSVQAKLFDVVSVKDFGAKGDGVTDDTAAINAAIASGALRIMFPPGTYNTAGNHSLDGRNGLQLLGAGVGASILNVTHASNNLFYTGATVTNNLLISGFTVTSTSVVRTGGWVFAVVNAYNGTGALSNSTISNLQIMKQVNGLWIAKYQFVNVEDVLMYSWVGTNGRGLQVGQTTTTNVNQGSQCYLKNVQIYGNDLAGGAPILSTGLYIEDCDAVQAVDCGIGGVLTNDMLLQSNAGGHGPSNHFFVDCVFDATKNGACVVFSATGTFQQIMFTGCWIASAGRLSGGAIEATGLTFTAGPTYSDVSFIGGTVYNCNGTGIYIAKGGTITISGVKITGNGSAAATDKYGIWVNPSSAASLGLNISSCTFSNSTGDIRFEANSRDYTVTGCYFSVGVTNLGASCLFDGNYDKTSNTVASATTISVSSNKRFFNVTGTTNIGGITATFADHVIQLKFAGVLTVLTASQNIQLASNFTTAAGSVLTLMCDGATWYEIGRKA